MRVRYLLSALALGLSCAAAGAQVALPPLGDTLGRAVDTVRTTADPLLGQAGSALRAPADLARSRIDRLTRFIRQNRTAVEADRFGAPARRGELVVITATDQALDGVLAAGFTPLGTERLDTLDIVVNRFSTPKGMPLAKAETLLATLLPGAEVSADPLYFAAGSAASPRAAPGTGAPATIATPIGIVDGAPGAGIAVRALRGFATGAPKASDHGSAVASLLAARGASNLLAADVYGGDPAGGSALALGKAIDWLAASGARVVSLSLVGPPNPLLARVVARGQERGLIFVAAVGNDGPAAPPAYPASYPGVIAVSAVDARNRPLIEAGHALHLDYTAPGADMTGLDRNRHAVALRGTSFATPLVAARAAAAIDRGQPVIRQLDSEALDLGPAGPDPRFGRGVVCSACRTR